ncbi:hypothetical protein EJB05_54043, partial [Eragrostis curvula]
MATSLRVAVIGAGAAGLAAARELRGEGHAPVVFKRAGDVGGTWIYDAAAEGGRSSLYASLRTNLPREVMGFLDFPFAAVSPATPSTRAGSRPTTRCCATSVQAYARRFELRGLIRFRAEVIAVRRRRQQSGWSVRWRRTASSESDDEEEEEAFDAVVVCNGHYTEPRVADDIPVVADGAWPGKQMHSRAYRVPDPFAGQVVVIVGASNSGADISRDIAAVAKEVHMANRAAPADTCRSLPGAWLPKLVAPIHGGACRGRWQRGVPRRQNSVKANIIMHCTGYKYSFPFLGDDSTITIDDNRIHPLYKHVFPPQAAPYLSFIGLPGNDGRCESLVLEMEATGTPKRHTHCLKYNQFEYDDWLAEQSGHAKVEEWSQKKKDCPETYRDQWEWDDHHLLEEANQYFQKYL